MSSRLTKNLSKILDYKKGNRIKVSTLDKIYLGYLPLSTAFPNLRTTSIETFRNLYRGILKHNDSNMWKYIQKNADKFYELKGYLELKEVKDKYFKMSSDPRKYTLIFGQPQNVSQKNVSRYKESVRFPQTLPFFIEKFGEIQGPLKYKELVSRKTKMFTYEGHLDKYGPEEGKRKWALFSANKKRNFPMLLAKNGREAFEITLHNFPRFEKIYNIFKDHGIDSSIGVQILGELIDGDILKKSYQSSRAAKIFIEPILEYLNQYQFLQNSFGWSSKTEKIFTRNGKSYKMDFINEDLKLAIEYDGRYYHSNPKQQEVDAIKADIMVEHGYTLFRFREGIDVSLDFYTEIKEFIKDKYENQKNN